VLHPGRSLGDNEQSTVTQDSEVQTLVALPSSVTRVRAVRGTVIAASHQALRGAGLFERYWQNLPAALHDSFRAPIANSWIPTDEAFGHYRACDALDLPTEIIDMLGREAGHSVNAVFVRSVLKLTSDVVTPWFAWPHAARIWARGWDGSAIGVERAGPKDVRVTVVGFSFASLRYVQRGLCGFLVRNTELFCRRAHGQILPSPTQRDVLRYLISWV
jgi:hypothetical protein